MVTVALTLLDSGEREQELLVQAALLQKGTHD